MSKKMRFLSMVMGAALLFSGCAGVPKQKPGLYYMWFALTPPWGL